jgi:hypothetical protein
MDGIHHVRRYAFLATAVVAASAWAASAWSDSAKKPSGPRIEMGVGHLNRDGKAFHYWDSQKEIPAVCARCHAVEGVPQYLRDGKNTAAAQVKNAFACTNCHADMLSYARQTVAKVTFPGGISVDTGHNDSNLCMTCHQGRESTVSVNKAIEGSAPDTPNPKLQFIHVHYFPAGATNYGTDAKVAYEYAGKTYAGRFTHVPNVSTCTSCHEAHSGELMLDRCGACHAGVAKHADLSGIRMAMKGDFDGNGREDGIAREIASLHQALYTAIQQYARNVGGTAIAFTKDAHPYWYRDENANGRVDPEELRPNNAYPAYTPRLLQAIYNHSFVTRDPGAAYHNGRYTLQVLYDSLDSLAASGKAGVDMKGKVRP